MKGFSEFIKEFDMEFFNNIVEKSFNEMKVVDPNLKEQNYEQAKAFLMTREMLAQYHFWLVPQIDAQTKTQPS